MTGNPSPERLTGFHPPDFARTGRLAPILANRRAQKPFCRLIRFNRFSDDGATVTELKTESIVLVCAPLSGHPSTLLRDTVKTLLHYHTVYLTDWLDARMVPLENGTFHLDDYVQYVHEFIRHIGPKDLHVISACQPTVPVLAAISLTASRGEDTPRTMTMMGGLIDARRTPTSVNSLARWNIR